MDFIIDNLVWFITGGVVILMTVIGYFAEKTDFGKKLTPLEGENNNIEEPKKNKEKINKKEEKIKKETKIKEKLPEIQPLEETVAVELPIPVINSNSQAILEQQINDILPVETKPIETDIVDNNLLNVDLEPSIVETSPLDLNISNLKDNGPTIKPFYEEENANVIEEQTIMPTIENVVPDELPVGNEEKDNNIVEEPIYTTIEQPVIPIADMVSQMPFEEPSISASEKPILINDDNVVQFDEIAEDMEMPSIPIEQGIPSINMELPNLETIVQDNVLPDEEDEEDIWKF